jgi:hypothetical protein
MNAYWMFTEWPPNVHWMFTECSLNVHWTFTEFSLNVAILQSLVIQLSSLQVTKESYWWPSLHKLNRRWMFPKPCRMFPKPCRMFTEWSLNVHWMFTECSLNVTYRCRKSHTGDPLSTSWGDVAENRRGPSNCASTICCCHGYTLLIMFKRSLRIVLHIPSRLVLVLLSIRLLLSFRTGPFYVCVLFTIFALDLKPQTLNPKALTLNPDPKTLRPHNLKTLNSKT